MYLDDLPQQLGVPARVRSPLPDDNSCNTERSYIVMVCA